MNVLTFHETYVIVINKQQPPKGWTEGW